MILAKVFTFGTRNYVFFYKYAEFDLKSTFLCVQKNELIKILDNVFEFFTFSERL